MKPVTLFLLVPTLALSPLLPVAAQTGAPIMVGRDADNGPICFRRETGDSHRLEIGIGRAGAYVQLDTGEPRDTTARSPVRVYAGKEIEANGKATGRFKVIESYEGPVRVTLPKPDRASFRLQASGDPLPFLATVAAARGDFLVVESLERPDEREYVAVYDFTPAAAGALIECARANVK